jgi:hypothetical protein
VVQLGARTGDREFSIQALEVVEESGLQPDAGLYFSFMVLASSEGCGPEALEVGVCKVQFVMQFG